MLPFAYTYLHEYTWSIHDGFRGCCDLHADEPEHLVADVRFADHLRGRRRRRAHRLRDVSTGGSRRRRRCGGAGIRFRATAARNNDCDREHGQDKISGGFVHRGSVLPRVRIPRSAHL